MEVRTKLDLLCAFAIVQARRAGWVIECVKYSRSSLSRYVLLRHPDRRPASVRISDHAMSPGGRKKNPRTFSVQVRSVGKLERLGEFLISIASPERASLRAD